MQMDYAIGKTKKSTQNDITSTIEKLVLEVIQMSKIDSGWVLRSDKHVFDIILKFVSKSPDRPFLLY